MKYFLFCAFFLITFTSFSQTRVLVDGLFDEWNEYPVLFNDAIGDNGSSGIDFGEIQVFNDEDYLFFLIEVGVEINLQDLNNISIYLDTDDNINSGLFVNGIGADLVYTFGDRNGTFYKSGDAYNIYHDNIGLITAPTVTSDRFEIAIKRDSKVAGNFIFQSDKIKVVFRDDNSNGDIIPEPNEEIEYEFSSEDLESLPAYSIKKSSESDLRIISYNVLFDGLFELNRYLKFRRVLSAIDPDIIGFQEIYEYSSAQVSDQVESMLKSEVGEQWYHAKEGPDCHAISRYPILKSAKINGSSGNAGNGAFLIDIPGIDMLLIVAHPPCCDKNSERQKEVDLIMEFVREAKAGNGPIPLEENAPIVILGDMNFVGDHQQVKTLLTGDIINETSYGPDFNPDWNGEDFIDSHPYITGLPFSLTWYDEGSSFSPGRLDYIIYSGSNLELQNNYSLFTPALPQDSLDAYDLLVDDIIIASDHLPVVSDFKFKNLTAQENEFLPKTNGIQKIVPNPTSGLAQVTLISSESEFVKLKLMDQDGRIVAIIKEEVIGAGKHEWMMNTTNIPSGVYYLKMQTSKITDTKKLIILD